MLVKFLLFNGKLLGLFLLDGELLSLLFLLKLLEVFLILVRLHLINITATGAALDTWLRDHLDFFDLRLLVHWVIKLDGLVFLI